MICNVHVCGAWVVKSYAMPSIYHLLLPYLFPLCNCICVLPVDCLHSTLTSKTDENLTSPVPNTDTSGEVSCTIALKPYIPFARNSSGTTCSPSSFCFKVISVDNDPSIKRFLSAIEVRRRLNAGSREGRGSSVILRLIGRSINQYLVHFVPSTERRLT